MAFEYDVLQFLHMTGMALGAGGATVAMVLSMKAEKDGTLKPALMMVMPLISKVIGAGLIIVVLSGFGFSALAPKVATNPNLPLKIGLTALLVATGLLINFRLMPDMQKLAPKPGSAPSKEFGTAYGRIKIAASTGLVLWYAALFYTATSII